MTWKALYTDKLPNQVLIKGCIVRKNNWKTSFWSPSFSLFSYITCHFSNGMQSCNLTSKLKENLIVSDVCRHTHHSPYSCQQLQMSNYFQEWSTIKSEVRTKIRWTPVNWNYFLPLNQILVLALQMSHWALVISDCKSGTCPEIVRLWTECCISRISMQNILFIYARRDYQTCTQTPPFC